MPAQVRQRFIARHDVHYFPGGGRAFVDGGDQLRTRSENRHVIQSLASIAHARGWHAISVRGTDRFKQQLWLAARLAGLEVVGYRAEARLQTRFERERSRLARLACVPTSQIELPALSERTSAPSAASQARGGAQRPMHAPREWRGRLIEHRAAPYRHEPANGASYFVRLRTRNGELVVWGVDLQRALGASASHPVTGDEVVVRRIGQAEVRMRPSASRARGEHPHEAARKSHRHRYWIETRAFLEERGRLARVLRDTAVSAHVGAHRHPTLAPLYLQLRASELFARRFSHREDQRTFVHRVRRAVADSLARGEPPGRVGLRVRERDRSAMRPDRAAAPTRT